MPYPFRGLSSRTWALCLFLALLATLLPLSAARAQDDEAPGRVGRIAEAEGGSWMVDDEGGDWVAAQRNRPLTAGDKLSTDRGGRMLLGVGSATLHLDHDTEIEFISLDDDHVRVRLKRGGLALRVPSTSLANEFEVVTDDGRFLPTRAGHVRVEMGPQNSRGTVWEGSLRFDAPDSALDLSAGQSAEFWREEGTTHYSWSRVAHDDFSAWARARDQRDEVGERRWAEREVSPEMTGVDELDHYGEWDRHPEYGTVWYPSQVAVGWAPYRYGHWAWVRPWGWSWVDAAPWGFAPFHYGRWMMWRNRWCWAPGAYVARPVYAPALVGWVGGPSLNVNVHVGGGGHRTLPPYVGWVPLAPRDHFVPTYRVRRPHAQRVAPPPPGAVRYANQGLKDAVTVVPSQVVRERQPISRDVTARVDPRVVQQVSVQRPDATTPPPAPVGRPAQQVRRDEARPGWRDTLPPSRGGERADRRSPINPTALAPDAGGRPAQPDGRRVGIEPVARPGLPEARDPQDGRGGRELRGPRDGREPSEARDARDAREPRDARAPRDVRQPRDSREPRSAPPVRRSDERERLAMEAPPRAAPPPTREQVEPVAREPRREARDDAPGRERADPGREVRREAPPQRVEGGRKFSDTPRGGGRDRDR